MMEFTKERLQEIAEDGFLKHGEAKAMARQLLAGMEQEPVAWVSDKDKCDPDVFERGITACVLDISKHEAETICRGFSAATGCKVDWHFVGGRVHIKALRAAPQLPQPAVMDENGLLPCPFCGSPAEHYPDGDMEGYSVMCGHKNGDCDSWIFGFATPEEAERSWNTRAAMLHGDK